METPSTPTTDSSLIQITERAREELLRLNLGADRFLRITLVAGGCSGTTYKVYIDSVLTPLDRDLYRDDKLRVVTDSKSVPQLRGLEIDHSDDLMQVGFRFKNPNAAGACSCGSSFSS
jgi:iron-sulfur cluster assembly accessory protein